MSISNLIQNYSSYNWWANLKLTEWLKSVDTNILYQTTTSSFKTIDYTLQHILRTQNFWLAFISEKNVSDFNWDVREKEVDLILTELTESSARMKDVFSGYTETELMKALHLNMSWCQNKLSRFEYIMHVINHSTYHRGQIITMAHNLGVIHNIVNTDYNFYRTE